MIDSIIIMSAVELLCFALLDMAENLNFSTVVAVVFFFAMILIWLSTKESKE